MRYDQIVAAARRAKGMTTKHLADTVGTSHNEIKRGGCTDLHVAVRTADVLGVDRATLLQARLEAWGWSVSLDLDVDRPAPAPLRDLLLRVSMAKAAKGVPYATLAADEWADLMIAAGTAYRDCKGA